MIKKQPVQPRLYGLLRIILDLDEAGNCFLGECVITKKDIL